MLPYVRGLCVEIGCGHRKTDPGIVGFDLTRGGALGTVGNVLGRQSQADVASDGSALPIRSGCVTSLIARHNLEHYVDTVAVLTEWRRVLGVGGTLAVIGPDEARFPGGTLDLDPTHYHAFTEESLKAMVEVVGGFRVVSLRQVIPEWSFMFVAERIADC